MTISHTVTEGYDRFIHSLGKEPGLLESYEFIVNGEVYFTFFVSTFRIFSFKKVLYQIYKFRHVAHGSVGVPSICILIEICTRNAAYQIDGCRPYRTFMHHAHIHKHIQSDDSVFKGLVHVCHLHFIFFSYFLDQPEKLV